MGLSSKKSKTTPIVTDPMSGFLFNSNDGFAQRINEFGEMGPTQFVAPASPLQERAFAGAQNLGGWKPYADRAFAATEAAGANPASSVDFSGYNAPRLGAATQATAARLANPATADFRSILEGGGINQYMDPALESYVYSTLANFDLDAAEQRARMQAQGAGAGAFGGSRWGVQEGTYDAKTALGRGQLEGGLRRDAFTQGLGAALSEAGRRQDIDLTNAAARNQFGLTQGGYDQQANMYNAGMANDFARAQFGADTDAARFGAETGNQESLTNAQLQEQQYQRVLQAAGLIGDLSGQYGAQDRADLGLTADLGTLQREIERDYLNATPTQLQMMGSLYGMIPPSAYIGSKSKTSGLGTWLPGLAGSAMQAIGSAYGGGFRF